MPDRSDLKGRYAAAEANTKAAEDARDAALARDSAALLARLKRRSVDDRFAALADSTLQLTAADRRALVKSIRSGAPSRPNVAANTATRWEVWRSRLPYRAFSLGVAASVLISVVAMGIIADRRTAVQWLTIQAPGPIMVLWTYPHGGQTRYQINPGGEFAAIGFTADQVQLRSWEPGTGYATFWVPRTSLTVARP